MKKTMKSTLRLAALALVAAYGISCCGGAKKTCNTACGADCACGDSCACTAACAVDSAKLALQVYDPNQPLNLQDMNLFLEYDKTDTIKVSETVTRKFIYLNDLMTVIVDFDNGPMAQSLMDTGQVTWLREDGFKFRPTRSNISWMVCDMVEKPAKVAALMAQWLVNGWCRETIFNLKLPMKKRYEEVSHNLAYIQAQLDEHGINAQIQARQLYHDREEVTVHVRRIWAAVGGRRDER